MGLCYNYDEQLTRGHNCKHLCDITLVNDVDLDLMMMIGTHSSGVHGWRTMFLAGVVLGQGVHILVDTGATHNILDVNFAQLAGSHGAAHQHHDPHRQRQ